MDNHKEIVRITAERDSLRALLTELRAAALTLGAPEPLTRESQDGLHC